MDDEIRTSVSRMGRDLRAAAETLSRHEARFLVDAYYMMQDQRIRSSNQVRALSASGEPHDVLLWLFDQSGLIENNVKAALGRYSEASAVGVWSRGQLGIGPVIAAGLLAHIDIEKAHTVGNIWNFAGLNPTVKWEKGKKRPWNAALKTLCWKIGESFVKVSGNANAYYGQAYVSRKAVEVERNESGELADQAAEVLAKKNIGKSTDAYKAYITGKLPPAHVHARAKRWTVKLFLSHWHHVAYLDRFGYEPPEPYALAYLGHAHYMVPPK